MFTGYEADVQVNLEQELLISDFTLELKFCWVVFIATALTFLLFVVALFIASFEKSDNVRTVLRPI